MKAILFFLITFIFICQCEAQGIELTQENSQVKLLLKIVEIDSQYYVQPIVSTLKKIQLKENTNYCDGFTSINYSCQCKIYLQKKVRDIYAYITLGTSEQFTYDLPPNKLVDCIGNKNLPMVNLHQYYPLEIGSYSVMLELNYLFEGKSFVIQSQPFFFNVNYLSKKILF
jgi:hypothetical protein